MVDCNTIVVLWGTEPFQTFRNNEHLFVKFLCVVCLFIGFWATFFVAQYLLLTLFLAVTPKGDKDETGASSMKASVLCPVIYL